MMTLRFTLLCMTAVFTSQATLWAQSGNIGEQGNIGKQKSVGASAVANNDLKESDFCKSLTAGKFILPAKEGFWNWGMAPIYDAQGQLHIFNSRIPLKGKLGMGLWQYKSKIDHYVADSIEGPYKLVDTPFESDIKTYHNPQVSKIGDTYVIVFMTKANERKVKQSIGMATATSLNGPWVENPNNPIIRPILGTPNAKHASNPSLLVDREGKFRIYYKSMSSNSKFREISLAIADKLEGPYVDSKSNPLIGYKDAERDIEDPYAFFYRDSYYMLLEDRMDVASLLAGNPSEKPDLGGMRPGLLYKSKDGIKWERPEIGFKTVKHYFGKVLTRSERPNILWKDGHPEYLFLANHDYENAGFYLKINGWDP